MKTNKEIASKKIAMLMMALSLGFVSLGAPGSSSDLEIEEETRSSVWSQISPAVRRSVSESSSESSDDKLDPGALHYLRKTLSIPMERTSEQRATSSRGATSSALPQIPSAAGRSMSEAITCRQHDQKVRKKLEAILGEVLDLDIQNEMKILEQDLRRIESHQQREGLQRCLPQKEAQDIQDILYSVYGRKKQLKDLAEVPGIMLREQHQYLPRKLLRKTQEIMEAISKEKQRQDTLEQIIQNIQTLRENR